MALSVHIVKRLPAFTLRVDFDTDGEVLALLGASGCGKSMTLKCIAGVEIPDSGRIVLNGRTLFDSAAGINLKPQQRRVGYLFQSGALFPHMTVEENVMAGVLHGKGEEKRRIAQKMLAELELTAVAHRKPAQISGGERQRTALGRILVNEPQVLLLDEPFTALDSHLKWQLELLLSAALEQFGGDTVLVSHDRGEVRRLCRSVCVLTEGKSEKKAAVEELFSAPNTVAAALISGCKNITDARMTAEGIFCPAWGVTLRGEQTSGEVSAVGIRAHHLYIAEEREENAISCKVERVIEDVFSTVVMLRTDGGGMLRMEVEKRNWAYAVGDAVTVAAMPKHVLTLRKEGEG